MEPEFNRFVPEGISVHVARMMIEDSSENGLAKMEKGIELAARQVKGVGPDIIVFGCTSGSFFKGSSHNDEIARFIKDITGIPVITASQAVVNCLKEIRIRKIVVATPYTDEVNQKEKAFLEENRIEVLKIKGLGFYKYEGCFPLIRQPVSHIGLQEPYVAYKLALEVFVEEADGIFISCTNFRTFEIIEKLEHAVNRPVVTSSQACLAFALQILNIRESIPGLGRILSLNRWNHPD
jgi:maleate isomerase